MMNDSSQWFSDTDKLLKRVTDTNGHWGQLPEIPGYNQLVEVRRGGQGVVYRARQQSTDRTVAIKVLLDGIYASDNSRLRFQRETALAVRLRHPNIVPTYDSGVMSDERLFYVMEFVCGKPLDDPSLKHVDNLFETLSLFLKICDAVNYAHQRGVIHRDLKPSNILINESGEPKILDFGLAKIARDSPAEANIGSSISQTGQFLGSLAWASPEQFEGLPDRIDIRTDVYSLGVILYQLIVGRLPYAVTPNLRETLHEITTSSPTRPRTIRREIPDDVETIVLRCLAKDPERRYQMVGDLANDIRRYLAGDPIDAKRDKKWYVLRRTLAQHKLITYLSMVFIVSTLVFAVMMAILYRRAESAEQLAQTNLEVAQTQTAKVEAVREFLERMLSSANPAVSADHSLTVRQMLDYASRQIGDRFVDHPEVEAEIRSVIGSAYNGLGLLDKAEEQQRYALAMRRALYGDEHTDVATSLLHLGETLIEQRRFDEAETNLQLALSINRRQLGADDSQVANCLLSLANLRHGQLRFEEANEKYSRAFEILKNQAGSDDDQTIVALIRWSDLLVNMREFESASLKIDMALEKLNRRKDENNPLLSNALQTAALVKMYSGKFEAAIEALQKAVKSHRAVFGDSHPRLAEIYNLMGDVRREQGRFADAEVCHSKALVVCEQLAGRESPEGARSLWAMGQARWKGGDLDSAEPLLVEAIEIRRNVYEPNHHLVAMSVFQLGKMQYQANRDDKALPLLEESVEVNRVTYGNEHSLTISATADLGMCLASLSRYKDGEHILLNSYALLNESGKTDDPRRLRLLQALVKLYTLWNKPEIAAEYHELLP